MIKLSGKHIIRFLQVHYNFVRDVFNIGKPDFIIDEDTLVRLINDYNSREETKISISKLIDVKFCRQLPTKDFKINRSYVDFLQFIFDDFTLDLPETLKNRYQTVFNLFTNLKSELDINKSIILIQNIINVIEVFLNDIHRQTHRLLYDTEYLKVNADDYADLTKRLEKAIFWVDEYIEPLNKILEKGHPESFYSAIVEIQDYSSEKRFLTENYKLRTEFSKLYASALLARTELDKNLQKLTRELKPLLDRIKSDSMILSGFYHFVENIDDLDAFNVKLPALIKKNKSTAIFDEFSSKSQFYIDQYSYKSEEVYYEESSEEIEWLPDSKFFKDELIKDSPVADFYLWCFDKLSSFTDEITLSKYFSVSNLLLEENLIAEYNDTKRSDVVLKDAIISVPKVKVYEGISS